MKNVKKTVTLCGVLLTLLIGASETANAFQQSDGPIFQLIRLNHSEPNNVRNLVEGLLRLGENETTSIIADERTNSLLIKGTSDRLSEIRALIEQLDVPTPETARTEYYQSYRTGNHEVGLVYDVVATMVAGSPNVRLDVDESTGRIHVFGAKDVHEIVKGILEMLAKASPSSTNVDGVYVSLSLIVEAGQIAEDRQSALKDTTAEIDKLLAEASELELFRFDNPKLACSLVTHVQCGAGVQPADQKQGDVHQFRSSSWNSSTGYRVEHHGSVNQAGEQFRIESDIDIQVNGDGSQNIATDILAPLDHSVVLSFSSIRNVDSVIIIKLVSKQ